MMMQFMSRNWRKWSINRPIVTSEFVIVELGNACARAEDHADFLALIEGMRQSPRIAIIPLEFSNMESRPGTDEQARRQELVINRLHVIHTHGARGHDRSPHRRQALSAGRLQ